MSLLKRKNNPFGREPSIVFLILFIVLIAVLLIIDIFYLPPIIIGISLPILMVLTLMTIFNSFKGVQSKPEKELSGQVLQTIIQNFQDGIVIYDPDFYLKTFNPAAEKIFQLTAEEMLGKKIEPSLAKNNRFRILAQTIFPSLAPSLRQISETDSWPQVVILNFENPLLELKTTLSRILDKNGRALNFIKVIHDQTREKAALRSKSEFVSVAAHQLRTPLTAINWTFENLIKDVSDKPDLKESVQKGFQASTRALKIVNDLLNVAQMEEGRFGYQFEEVDLINFIQIILGEALPLAKERGLNVYFEKPTLPIKVKIDQQKLGIALANIIDNAIKYNTENGRLTITIEKIRDQPFVKVNVEDTGFGIAPEELKNIFQKFFRGSNIISVNPNGSGLGLYITKNIIDQHGGQIGIESILGRGTTVYFTLPLDYSLIPSREITQKES